MKKNKILKTLLSSWKIKTFIAILLTCVSICTISFINISKKQYSITLNINDHVIIDKILINGNNFLGTENDLSKYLNKKEKYELNDNIVLKLNKLEKVKISYNTKYSQNIEVTSNELTQTTSKNKVTLENHIDKVELLKEHWQNDNVTVLYFSFFVAIFLASYILISIIDYFVANIKEKFSIPYFILATFSAFLLIYLNFYTLQYLVGAFAIAIIALPLIYLFKRIYNKKIEFYKIFIVVLTYFSLIFMFLVPSFNIPYEGNHFGKVYNSFLLIPHGTYSNLNVKIDENTYNFYMRSSNHVLDADFKINSSIYFEEYVNKISNNFDYSVRSGTINAINFAYIPANIAVQLCKLLKTSVLFMFMFGRFANFMCYILLCYFALKVTPKFKYAFALAMMLPITIHQSIGINQDCLNNAFVFASLAFMFKLIFENKSIEKKDIILLLLLMFGVIRSKVIYGILILFVLLIDNKKFKKPLKTKAILIGLTLLMLVLSYFRLSGILKLFGIATDSVIQENSYYTIGDLIKNPVNTIIIYLNTIKSRLTLDLFSGLYNGFGWSKVWISNSIAGFTASTSLLLLIITLPHEEIKEFKGKYTFNFIALCMGIILYLVIGLGLLIGWTPKGATSILGLQCRYYIPVVLLIYIFLSNDFIKYNGKHYNLFFILMSSMMWLVGVATMIRYFYI